MHSTQTHPLSGVHPPGANLLGVEWGSPPEQHSAVVLHQELGVGVTQQPIKRDGNMVSAKAWNKAVSTNTQGGTESGTRTTEMPDWKSQLCQAKPGKCFKRAL